jgi:hypothetical protein
MKSKDPELIEKAKVASLVRSFPDYHKDLKKLLDVYDTYNPMFSIFEDIPEYLERRDGAAFRKLVGGLSKFESYERKDVRVELLGRHVAVATGYDDWTSKTGRKVTEGRFRFTMVLKKSDRTWKVMHEHFTRIE